MLDMIALIGVFLIGVIASVLGSMVGGGSLLSIPFLILVGLPPQVAIATDRFGSVGAAITAFFKFWKAKKIAWKHVPVLSALSLAGSLIGANILLNVNPDILQSIIGVMLLALLPLMFIKRDIGVQHNKAKGLKMALGLGIYFLVQVFTGFFGGGTGPIIFYVLMIFFGLTIIEASATQMIPVLVLYISSLAIFALNGIIDFGVGIILFLGMATGGYIGAHIALKKGDKWVKGLFAVMVIVLCAKLLFF